MTAQGSPEVSTSPLLTHSGAVEASGADAGVAWHYGDPTAEQRALEAGAGVVDQSHLGVVSVTGPDRLTWLDSLSTQALKGLTPGSSAEMMILSPQGRVEHVAAVVDDGETTWLITETAELLAAFLDRMRFMLRVEVHEATADWAVVGESTPDPASLPGGHVIWTDPWPSIVTGGTSYADASSAGGAAWHWSLVLVPRGELASYVDLRLASGAGLAGTWGLEALRIAAHRPRAALEVDTTSLPHEFDWLRTAVHLHKGCYRGQETVAKVHNVGRPPRRLTLLHLDGSAHVLPEPGAPVTLGEGEGIREAGHITSVSRHHELGPIALALLKRSTDPGATLTVQAEGEAVAASQELIVNAEGFSVDRPPAPGPTMKGLLMGKGCAADGGDMS